MNKKNIILALLLAGTLAGLAYLTYAYGLADLFFRKERLIEFIREHPQNAAFYFIGLQALQVVIAPVPGELTGFAGGLIFGPAKGIIYSTIGLTIGSWFAFMLARSLGRPLVEKIVSPGIIARYDYVMKHKGLFLAFLMFLIPGFPKDYLCYLLGLGRMRHRDFLLVSVPGRLLGTVLLTMGGAYFRRGHYGALSALVGISLVVILVVLMYREQIERWFRRMRAIERLKAAVQRRRARQNENK